MGGGKRCGGTHAGEGMRTGGMSSKTRRKNQPTIRTQKLGYRPRGEHRGALMGHGSGVLVPVLGSQVLVPVSVLS